MNYAISLRFPVTRTFPSEVEIPGRLYINVSAFSSEGCFPGSRVLVKGVSVPGEVLQSMPTRKGRDDFKYEVAHG